MWFRYCGISIFFGRYIVCKYAFVLFKVINVWGFELNWEVFFLVFEKVNIIIV